MAKSPVERLSEYIAAQGLQDAEAARRMGVSKQVLRNWKSRNAIPPKEHKRVAAFMRIPVDQLLGLSQPPVARVAESTVAYGYGLTERAARLGAEWQKLDEPLRSQIETLIETLVAAQVRDGRKKKQSPDQPRVPLS